MYELQLYKVDLNSMAVLERLDAYKGLFREPLPVVVIDEHSRGSLSQSKPKIYKKSVK